MTNKSSCCFNNVSRKRCKKYFCFCFPCFKGINPKQTLSYPKKLFSRARVQSAICYLGLFGQVLCTFNWGDHSLHSQKSSQVGGIGGDDDQGEKPPNTADNASRQRPVGSSGKDIVTCQRNLGISRIFSSQSVKNIFDNSKICFICVSTKKNKGLKKQTSITLYSIWGAFQVEQFVVHGCVRMQTYFLGMCHPPR